MSKIKFSLRANACNELRKYQQKIDRNDLRLQEVVSITRTRIFPSPIVVTGTRDGKAVQQFNGRWNHGNIFASCCRFLIFVSLGLL